MTSTISFVGRSSASCRASWPITLSIQPTFSNSYRHKYNSIHSHPSRQFSNLCESKLTRHWIHSFHRMTLYSHLYHRLNHTARIPKPSNARPYHSSNKSLGGTTAEAIQESSTTTNYEVRETIRSTTSNRKPTPPSRIVAQPKRSGAVARNDSPLFSRRSVGKRWTPGSNLIESPKYRVVQDLGETRPFDENVFNPFSQYPTTETVDRLAAHPDDKDKFEARGYSDHWTINSLFGIKHDQSRLWRNDSRKVDPGHERMTLDEAIVAANEKIISRLFEDPTDHEESEYWSTEQSRLDAVQLEILSKILYAIDNPISTTSRDDIVTNIIQFGRMTLLKWGLPTSYVDLPSNILESARTGLDALVSVLSHSKEPKLATLVELLERDSLIQLLDQSSVEYLQSNIPRGQISDPELEESIINSLKKASDAWKMKEIDNDQWRIQTSRFRIQLAIARETGVMPSEADYAKFMRCCLRANQLKEIELTFFHYLDFHPGSGVKNGQNWGGEIQAGEIIYREYIKGLVKDGKVELAQEVLNGMKRRGIVPSVVTYGVMFDTYGRLMDQKNMKQTLKAMHNSGHFPNLEIYTSLIANYIRAGDIEKADVAYSQLLRRADIDIDPQCRNVIENLMRKGGTRLEFNTEYTQPNHESIVEQKKAKTKRSTLTPPPDPNLNDTIRFNHRLKKYSDSLNIHQFVLNYQDHVQKGVVPNTTTLNIVIKALLQSDQFESALDVLEHMKTVERTHPDVVTFSTLINGAVNQSDPDKGWELYSDMRERFIEPNQYVYVSLMELASMNPTHSLGRQLAKKYTVRGDNRIRFPVVSSVEEQIGLNFATEFYNQLCSQGLEPNQHVFCTLLNIPSSRGIMELAQHVYQEMLHKNVEPNSAIMTCLIKGFAACRDFESGWSVWNHMIENNIPRNVITYSYLIHLCKRTNSGRSRKKQYPDIKKGLYNIKPWEATKVGIDELQKSPQESGKYTRIPADIMTKIREQMKVDHVHWSRLHSFNNEKVDISRRIPKYTKVGPVASALDVRESADKLIDEMDEMADADKSDKSLSDGSLFKTSPIQYIEEFYTGTGDKFTFKRKMPKKILDWDPVTLMPTTQARNIDAKDNKSGGDEEGDTSEH